mmetsp:Transcript_6140/g.7786  ORF Transcript_6140/g.7786 Transcript_6140/m.7786 type:complete len:144 (+) Transcript_6140:822-1253(+)
MIIFYHFVCQHFQFNFSVHQYTSYQVRSPEEYLSNKSKHRVGLTEKVDVYSLGNVFYTILTKERVYQEMTTKQAQNLVLNSTFPVIPEEKIKLYDEMEKSIVHAMKMCQVYNASVRSHAWDVEEYLRGQLEKYNIHYINGRGI